MTVFEENKEQPSETNKENNEGSFLDSLVGDGKKFSSTEELAKSKAYTDEMIEQVKNENAQLREDLDKRVNMEEMLNKIKEERAAQPTVENTTPQLDEKSLEGLVSGIMDKRATQATVQGNLNTVDNKMKEIYGEDKASEMVATKAQAMGLKPSDLGDLAQKSPEAFYQLMGVTADKPSTPTVTTPSVRMDNFEAGNTGVKDKAYFDNLRRTDPRKYFSPAVQNEYMRLASGAIQQGKTF